MQNTEIEKAIPWRRLQCFHIKNDIVINVKVGLGEGQDKVPLDSIAKRASYIQDNQEYIEAKYGFKVHTTYIAKVKQELGLPMCDAPNVLGKLKQPMKPPTAERVKAIKDVLKHYELI